MGTEGWQRSSLCGGGGNNCVEVAAVGHDGVVLRESDDPARVLVASRSALAALLARVKTRRVG